jgi:hypothetical protein
MTLSQWAKSESDCLVVHATLQVVFPHVGSFALGPLFNSQQSDHTRLTHSAGPFSCNQLATHVTPHSPLARMVGLALQSASATPSDCRCDY